MTTTTTGRIASIDILRCIAIIGMILSSYIGFNSDLPGWMFHAQEPPPDHAFHPECRGISWVDLVFPLFLVSMGAALPFSLKKRLARGVGTGKLLLGILRRWVTLTLFAVILGNVSKLAYSTAPTWAHVAVRLFIWAGLFLSLVHFREPRKKLQNILNLSGIAVLIAGAMLLRFAMGVSLGPECDVIIMILSLTSLVGALLYLLSIRSIPIRLGLVVIVAAVKAIVSYTPFQFPAPGAAIGWFFQWGYLQYLIPVLLGSIAGDMLLKDNNATVADAKGLWIAGCAISPLIILTQLWGLYTRHIAADIAITAVLLLVFALLSYKSRKEVWAILGNAGNLLILLGAVFDSLDGGIAKDPCTLSYLLLTSGVALSLTGALRCLEVKAGAKAPLLSAVGQNPMIAYTIVSFVILPLLILCGAYSFMAKLAEGSPFLGFTMGVFITALMMLCTAWFTKKGIFWRS